MFNNTVYLITKEFILDHITEEEIFVRYLGIEPTERGSFCNPKREDDTHPGCSFYINEQGRWKFKDYAGGFDWDCFNVVEYDWGLTFKEALLRIASDFGLIHNVPTSMLIRRPRPVKTRLELRIKRRNWTKKDLEFWKQFHITEDILTLYNVYPLLAAWFLDKGLLIQCYWYKESDPAYVYHFGSYEYKIYLPFRTSIRFLQGTINTLQGYNQLPLEGKNFLFTKSLKDVMGLRLFANEFDLWSVAPLSETVSLQKEQFSDIYNRFDNLGTLFDFDRTGIRLANKYKEEYQLDRYFFGKEFRGGVFKNTTGIKDFSDHLRIKGIDQTKRLIERFIALNTTQEPVF